jgi:hypothetical protein
MSRPPSARRREQKRRQAFAAITIHEIARDVQHLAIQAQRHGEDELPDPLREKLLEACTDYGEQFEMLAVNDQREHRSFAEACRRIIDVTEPGQ